VSDLPKIYQNLDTPTNRFKKFMKKVKKVIKMILFIAIIILTFKISERSSDYILNMTFEQLSRVINVVLVLAIVLICKRK